ncbi:MAG TPA: LacI family transcriptional regulator, partial [Lachnospiraceae bacterium]|nr:LacI family transcriptional regulator [Lachnospiraceae bacterium]
LRSRGHKNIAGVFKADDMQGMNRHRGYVMALQEAGILYDSQKVVWFYTEDRTIHPYEGICQMIRREAAIDAVVCYNDQIAVEVIQGLRDSGKRVPEDISVTGYDNSLVADFQGLHITAIAHPQEKLGAIAAELLLDLIQNGESVHRDRKIVIEPELIVGNSCQERKNDEKISDEIKEKVRGH